MITNQSKFLRILLSGKEILYSVKIPKNPVKTTVNVEYLLCDIPYQEYIPTQISIVETTEIAAGSALEIIFLNKLPCILSLFGSNPKINEGNPIVKELIKVICMGMNG